MYGKRDVTEMSVSGEMRPGSSSEHMVGARECFGRIVSDGEFSFRRVPLVSLGPRIVMRSLEFRYGWFLSSKEMPLRFLWLLYI